MPLIWSSPSLSVEIKAENAGDVLVFTCACRGGSMLSHSMQLSRSFRRWGYHVTDRQHEMPCLDGQENIMTQQIEKKKSFWYNISIILENQKQLFSVYIHPMNRLLSSQSLPGLHVFNVLLQWKRHFLMVMLCKSIPYLRTVVFTLSIFDLKKFKLLFLMFFNNFDMTMFKIKK